MLIGILGFIGSGKGTVADHLVEQHCFTQDSFAASLKDVCADIFNWDRAMLEGDTPESRQQRDIVDVWWSEKLGITDFTPRLALQLVGTDTLRNYFHNDLWLLTLQNRFENGISTDTVISDVRFPNEIQLVKNMGGILVEVQRDSNTPIWKNIALKANTQNDEDALREMRENFPEAHISEWAWVGTKPDIIITNNSSLQALKLQINQALFK